ncbi:MAG TPA: hypothetical protein VJS40_07445, partial [Aestuariivirgaceae bacterium]|nr:hypothetical protein [Aestuariivirgaceae bacterium]
ATPFDPMPGYAFSYWGQNTVQQTENGATLSNDDGVSVSRWNDDQGYNAHKGALFGLIKSVTSPLGATTTYQYTDAQGTLVPRTLEVDDFAPYTEVNATDAAVLAVDMAYDGSGRRTGRTVSNPATSETSTTDYWYGSGIDPLVIVRDGVSYRVIQGILIEQRQGDAEPVAQYFVFNDHLGSVRMVTDADGEVVESIGYDGDWGLTRIAGQASPSSYDAMTAFWRFQGKEQETFPLSRLGIDDTSLAAWLDDIQLYHFHYREYGAGLGAFLSIDPAGQDSSPYMAFGDNPANAVDPDGGAWRPLVVQFLFCVYWGAFWAFAESMTRDGNSYLKASFVVSLGRQAARYAQELTLLATARTEILKDSVSGDRTLVVATPELYERAPSGRRIALGHVMNIAAAFVTELVENGVFAGVPLTTFYRESPAYAMFVGLIVIGLVNVAAMTVKLQCCGSRGQVWRIRGTYPLAQGVNPERLDRVVYTLKSFDLLHGLSDTFGQGLLRVGYGAAMPTFDDSYNDAFAITGGWVARNVAGRGVTAVIEMCFRGCATPTDGKVAGLYLAFDDNGVLRQFAVAVHTYSLYGDRGPETISIFLLQYHHDSRIRAQYTFLFNQHNVIRQTFREEVAARARATSRSLTGTISRVLSRSNVEADRGANHDDEEKEFKDDINP